MWARSLARPAGTTQTSQTSLAPASPARISARGTTPTQKGSARYGNRSIQVVQPVIPSPQVYHRCTHGNDKPSFTRLCPVGTLYNQQYFVCDW